MARTLLFGGSFNPIHHGHLIVARSVAEQLRAERVILIPSRRPPHKSSAGLARAEDRLAMCRLAVEGEALFEVSDWETQQEGPNYTLLTIEHFRAALSEDRPAWLIGMDSLIDLPTWYQAGRLAERCTLVTAARAGFKMPELREHARLIAPNDLARIVEHTLETPRIDISSSQVRARLAAGLSVRYLVPDQVADHIAQSRELHREYGACEM